MTLAGKKQSGGKKTARRISKTKKKQMKNEAQRVARRGLNSLRFVCFFWCVTFFNGITRETKIAQKKKKERKTG